MTSPDPEPSTPLAAATLAVTTGRPPVEPNQPMSAPVMLSSTYVASDSATQPGDRGYGRWVNPTWTALEDAVAALEGGRRALAFASGMAVVAAVLDLSAAQSTAPCDQSATRNRP